MEAKPAPSANLLALPEGTELVGDYCIRRVLGAGGFGITYLADEKALGRLVTIKEYFPADFAARQNESASPRSVGASADFQWGLDRFIEEAQTLARFDHPNIVRVHRYFRANNTAYMVLHFEEGGSFKSWLKGLRRAPRQAEIDRMVAPLLAALEIIHNADFLHRDIAPDNIMVRKDGSPVLIDFGSARGAIACHSRTVSALVKPGYSPYEQYATTGANQGPWTDIYALGATLYHAITGKRPPDAPSRVVSDDYVPAQNAALSSYRAGFLAAIDKSLRIEVGERPRSIAEWRGALLASDPAREPARNRLRLPLARTLGRLRGAGAPPQGMGTPDADAALTEAPASLVPAPPDAPQRKGQLLDFIEALKGRRPPILAPARKKAAKARISEEVPPEASRPEPAVVASPAEPHYGLGYGPPPASTAGRNGAAAESAAGGPVPPVPLPAARQAPPKPRRAWRLPSRRWRSAIYRVAAAAAVASLAVAYQESTPHPAARATDPPSSEGAALSSPMQLVGHRGAVIAVASGDEGRWIVSAGSDATLRVWSPSSGSLVHTIELDDAAVTAFAVDDRHALVGYNGGIVVLWDLEHGKKLETFQHGDGRIVSLAFIGGANAFAAARSDGSVALFAIDSPAAPTAVLDVGASGGPLIAVARSRRLFVSGGSDQAIRLWRTHGPSLARVLLHRTGAITAIDISADGRYVVSAGSDGIVCVWTNPLVRGALTPVSLEAHVGRATAIALGPQGVLATAGEDGSVKLWSLRPARIVRTLAERIGSVRALSFSRDGRRLFAAGEDGAIRVWPLASLPTSGTIMHQASGSRSALYRSAP